MSIGDMPDELSKYIQDFLRPDLVKNKQKKLLKRFHFRLKHFVYCECDCCCDCPCPDVIQRLDDYKDSQIFFVTCNYEFNKGGINNFNEKFMMWYKFASGELTEISPVLERDMERFYSYIGRANEDFNFSVNNEGDDISLTECDLIKKKYEYLKFLTNS